jgi:hypothetical protein
MSDRAVRPLPQPLHLLSSIPAGISVWRVLLVMAIVAAPLAIGLTGAVFGSTQSVNGNAFTTATLLPPSALSATAACGTVAFGASTTAVSGTGAVTITKPAGVAAGDVLVAQYAVAANGGTVAAPAGWTLIRSDDNAPHNLEQFVYFHVAGAAEPANYTFTGSVTGVQAAAGIAAYQNVASVATVNAQGGQTNSKSISVTAPSIATTVANTALVGLFSLASNSAVSAPYGMTGRWNVSSGTTLQIAIADVAFVGPGASGAKTATGATADFNIGELIALRPSPGVTVSWTATPSTFATGYSLVRMLGAAVDATFPVSPRTTVTYSDTGVANATTYTYQLTSVDQNWTSTTIASGAVTTC